MVVVVVVGEMRVELEEGTKGEVGAEMEEAVEMTAAVEVWVVDLQEGEEVVRTVEQSNHLHQK